MAAPVVTRASGAICWIVDHATSAPPRPSDLATLSSSLDDVLAGELDGAQDALGCTADEILLAALGRTVARTIGDGMLIVELDANGASRRVAVPCVSRRDLSGSELLATARSGAKGDGDYPSVDVRLSYDEGAGEAIAAPRPYVLALQARRDSEGSVRLDWSYDPRSFDRYTVEELAEQFPQALVEVTSG